MRMSGMARTLFIVHGQPHLSEHQAIHAKTLVGCQPKVCSRPCKQLIELSLVEAEVVTMEWLGDLILTQH